MTTTPRSSAARDDTTRSLDDYVRDLVAAMPPLQQWQRDRIAALLRPARGASRRPDKPGAGRAARRHRPANNA
jgi:hypothetical protein